MDRRDYDYDCRRKYDRVRRDDRDIFRLRDRFAESILTSTYEEQRDEENYNILPYNVEQDHHSYSSSYEAGSDHKTMDFPGSQSFVPQSSDSSEIPLNPDMPLMAYQLQLMELMKSMCPAIIRPSCSLYPPKNSVPAPQRPKPVGCKTIYVSGLPDVADNDMVAEIFFPCGAIDSVNTRKSAKKIFSHVRFVNRASVDQAILFNGFEIIAEKGDRERRTLNVEYALEKNIKRDQDEYEREEREHYRLLDEQKKIQEAVENPPAKRRLTEYEASCMLDTLKSNTNFLESISQLKLWIEKGDINRKNANYVYNLISSLNSHVKRLVKEKKDHDQLIELQKFEQVTRAKEIKDQVVAIDEIFEKACLKKVWDNFTKPQRRNISQWKQHAKHTFKEIGLTREMSIEDRVEVGMELDEEDAGQGGVSSLGQASQSQESYVSQEEGLVPQSDTPSTQSGHVDTSIGPTESASCQGVDYFQQLKNPEIVPANEKTIQDLKYENDKLQAQVSCLKALVEQNTNLAMQLQTYKKDAELAKQEFNTAVQSREETISKLNTALYGLKLYLYNSGLPQMVLDNAPQDWGVTVHGVEVETESEQILDTNKSEDDSCANEKEICEDSQKIDDQPATADSSSEVTSKRSTQLRLSGVEMAQVGIICTYLSVCPKGALLADIVKHLECLSCNVSVDGVRKLLESLPTLFLHSPQDTQESQGSRWSFAGFESVKYLV